MHVLLPGRAKTVEIASALEFAAVFNALSLRLSSAGLASDYPILLQLSRYLEKIMDFSLGFAWSRIKEFDEAHRRSLALRPDRGSSPPLYADWKSGKDYIC